MQYGISNLSIVPMRSGTSDKAEMVNQILFGEHFKVLENQKKFSRIRLAHDDYEGWICNKQWIAIEKEKYNKLQKETPTLTTDILDIIKHEQFQPIVMGSTLPSYKSGHAFLNEEMYLFEGFTTQGFTEKKYIIENALMYLNTPYLWGGRSPVGIDCSGFIQMVYRLQGIKLPRDAYQQAEVGRTLKSVGESEAGDLAFFENTEGEITHVGIIMENNYIIHASGKVRIDKLDQQGIFNNDLGTHSHKFGLIKSII
jgi:hypothetical protein